jgi:curved DNA-binding protein CbpA
MSQKSLPPEWLDLLKDPYAILGLSVNADERHLLKRYHSLAKILHPDNYFQSKDPNKELSRLLFTRLINPAYEQLKLSKKRLLTIASLRFEAKSWDQEKFIEFYPDIAEEIMPMSAKEAQLFYEDAIASYAEAQYKSLEQSYKVTKQINILNLMYLYLQQDNYQLTSEPRVLSSTLAIKRPETSPSELTTSAARTTVVKPIPLDYAQRHYGRAVQYANQKQWNLAVQELRDAIKIDPNNSEYYALLGVVHFQQKFPGMAKVYIRQALKLNPRQQLALKYAAILKIKANEPAHPQSMAKALGLAQLLGKFLSGERS